MSLTIEKGIYQFQRFLWPKIFFPKKREEVKENLFSRKRLEREKNKISRKTPVKPWAFIRVKNEIPTLEMSLNNISTIITKGVIGYNECTDGSKEIILEFCKNNPSFIPYEYPHHIIPAHSEEYLRPHDYKNTLAAYYNAVLELIPKNEWLIKIDVDHFYFKDVMDYSFHLPENETQCVVYPRLNLVRDYNNIWYVINYTNPHDQWLIYNKNLSFKNKIQRLSDGSVRACEFLVWPKACRYMYKTECASLHFPYEKCRRNFPYDIKNLKTFKEFIKSADKNDFNDQALDPFIIEKNIFF